MRAVGGPAVVSVNGSRGAGDGPAVPLSPQDLAESAVRAVAAGAGEVLVHPRTPCGRESLSPRVVGPVLEVLRDAGVGVPLTVPASIAAEPDPAERPARVRAWTVLPDRAVVHFAEPGAAVLAEVLLERGVLVDAVAPLGGAAGPEPLERLRAWLVRSPGGDRGGVRVVAEIVAGKTGKRGRRTNGRPVRPACRPVCTGWRRKRCCCSGGTGLPGRCCGWPPGAVRPRAPAWGTCCTCRTDGRRGRMPNWSRPPAN